MRKLVIAEFSILLVGTLFAWTNFVIELIDWLNDRACSTGCAIGVANPFLTSCFYGAIVFTAAFILSAVMLKKSSS